MFGEHWVVNIGIFVVMYAALATAWNLIGGFSGYLSLGHVAFFGVGAYANSIAFERLGFASGYGPFLLLPAIGFGVAVLAIPIGWLALPHARRHVRHRHADARCSSASSWPSTCTR